MQCDSIRKKSFTISLCFLDSEIHSLHAKKEMVHLITFMVNSRSLDCLNLGTNSRIYLKLPKKMSKFRPICDFVPKFGQFLYETICTI